MPSATKALRSMPEQNVPPAPVRIATRNLGFRSKASIAATACSFIARLTALRVFGRLSVITAIAPRISTSTTLSSFVILPLPSRAPRSTARGAIINMYHNMEYTNSLSWSA